MIAAVSLLMWLAAPGDAPLTAEQAMARYHAVIDGAADDADGARRSDCQRRESEIVVCGKSVKPPPPRLPLPDDRAALGEVVRHPGEPPRASADQSPACRMSCEPSRLGQTIGLGVGLLKSLFTGEDPVGP